MRASSGEAGKRAQITQFGVVLTAAQRARAGMHSGGSGALSRCRAAYQMAGNAVRQAVGTLEAVYRGVVSHPVPETGSHLPFTAPPITPAIVFTTTPLAAWLCRKSRKAPNLAGEIT
jgi:hypothetical protein